MKNANFINIFVFAVILFLAEQTVFAQPKATSGYANVTGGQIYYEVIGRGKPIVFVHGGLVDSRLWDDQVKEFGKRYCVVRYDIRGHGRSAVPTEPYSLVEDLNQLLGFLKIDKASLIGLSLGGIIAADFALEHRGKVETLILVGPGLRGFETKPDEATLSIFRAAKQLTAEQAARLWLNHQFFAGLANKPRQRDRMLQMITDNYQAYTKIDHAKIYQLPEPATFQRLNKLTAPTLVINGGSDHPTSIEIGRALKEKIPNAEYAVIKGASHHPNLEKPKEFNRILAKFLREKIQ